MNISIEKLASKYNVKADELGSAMRKIQDNQVVLYAMSGKMGAGKDTIGDLVTAELVNIGFEVVQSTYSTSMREEILNITKDCSSEMSLGEIAVKHTAKVSEIVKLMRMLNYDSIYSRTDNSRRAIQYWGTDVRRKQNNNYWINKTVELTIDAINDNNCMYISDVRFPNEAESIIDLGGKIIRLNVPTDIRADRIMSRDGIEATYTHLNHLSEISLDNYKFERDFDGCKSIQILKKEALNYILD